MHYNKPISYFEGAVLWGQRGAHDPVNLLSVLNALKLFAFYLFIYFSVSGEFH